MEREIRAQTWYDVLPSSTAIWCSIPRRGLAILVHIESIALVPFRGADRTMPGQASLACRARFLFFYNRFFYFNAHTFSCSIFMECLGMAAPITEHA